MTAFEASTLRLVGRPDRAFGHLPVIEVSATQVLWGPMQKKNQAKVSSNVVAPHVLPVFADASSSLQSRDVLAPVVQLLRNLGSSHDGTSLGGLDFESGDRVTPRERGYRRNTPTQMESGFYRQYFVMPKKDGGLHSILDLRCLNLALRVSKFKILTVKSVLSVGQEPEHFTSFSSALQNYGDAQMLSRSKPVDETPFPSGGSSAGGVLFSQDSQNGGLSIKDARSMELGQRCIVVGT
ncbi:hypothetical protein H4Q32_007009 [Labeo rohita]|uniref:Uncharacterized protein n=1 Tax=Labeo rohita TaxID=84645 RepID=A0ABQ8MFB0_LABRO|nr:hypothetical protein H4Q32_007009 [Labeo rohita]